MFEKEYYTIEDIIRISTELQIHKAMKQYGAEGTEDVIKRIYKNTAGIRLYLLEVLYSIWRNDGKTK